jgi:LytR cell envelope-related transcriptional attenuator
VAPHQVIATATVPPLPHVAQSQPPGWFAEVPHGVLLRVSNGAGRRRMASRFADYLGEHGLSVGLIANAAHFNYKASILFYNPDQEAFAREVAGNLPFSVKLVAAKRGRGSIEVVLGSDLLWFDDTLRS